MNIFKQEILRNAEGEGAGGAVSLEAEGASPASDKFSALEDRLNKVAQTVEQQNRGAHQRDIDNRIEARRRELETAQTKTETSVNDAEKALADAYDNGEGVEIAKAQRALTEAVATREHAKGDLRQFDGEVERAKKAQPQAQSTLDDKNLSGWKQKHAEWYGVDAELTRAAHEIDRQIRDAGVISVGSTDYFNAVDRQLSQKFPDRFGGTPPTGGAGQGAGGQQTSRRGRIAQSIADGWRRMGINMDDPKVVDRMVKNRQAAVEKGILPDTPVSGSVITR